MWKGGTNKKHEGHAGKGKIGFTEGKFHNVNARRWRKLDVGQEKGSAGRKADVIVGIKVRKWSRTTRRGPGRQRNGHTGEKEEMAGSLGEKVGAIWDWRDRTALVAEEGCWGEERYVFRARA